MAEKKSKKTRLPIVNAEGLGSIVEVEGNFYDELTELSSLEARPISPRDEAYARLKTRGKENIGIIYGTRTSAGLEYCGNNNPILRLESRLLNPDLAKKVVKSNKAGQYYFSDSGREYEESLEQAEEDSGKDPKDRSVILLPSRDSFTIFGPNKEYWEVFEAIFKDAAMPFFKLTGPISIYPVAPRCYDNKNKTLLTQAWLRDINSSSGFTGNTRFLHNSLRLRGVLKSYADERESLNQSEEGGSI